MPVKPVLQINNLKTSFFTDEGEIRAVDGVTLTVPRGETIGLVGESGCGKSVTALSILQLIEKPGRITGGEIFFNDLDLVKCSPRDMLNIRGNQISMIFQEPMTSLNPVLTIGEQIRESYRVHRRMNARDAWTEAVKMLELVGIPSPEKRAGQYPYELSGGMRQRVMIAMALACSPDLLIADEPTTALDVTIQAQILELIRDLQQQLGMSVMIITHDLGIVAEMCSYVAVMYCGSIVEYAEADTLFNRTLHPYTIGLFDSLPRHDIDQVELQAIKGSVPNPANIPPGCRFAPRCPHARTICFSEYPALEETEQGSLVRCWLYNTRWDGPKEVIGSHG